ncbi:MAG: CoA-binding protein [Candidatus Woesearchaeota archaeon]|nr:CoA-binding protein [Candidatus Woesearchaeota archaeon]
MGSKEIKRHKLDKIFNPKSVALIGASRDEKSVGYGILKSLVKGCVFQGDYCKPFTGKIFPINPNTDEIMGIRCYKSILEIEEDIDLAIIAVPSKIVPQIMKECAKKKVSGAIIISAGFAELGEEGKRLQEETIKIAKASKIPVVGPNCLGIIRPSINLNSSFAPSMPPPGNVAFVSQSGAIADSVIDWAIEQKYGFSAIISYGNRADLDVYDFVEWLEKDEETKAIAIYLEGINDGRRFVEVASRVSKKKPIIALKAGRTEEGTKAISSHTGSLAGSYEIYKAAFKQSGIIVAETIEELFDLAKALANQPKCRENSIAIITNGGGCGVLCADYCSSLGIGLAELKKSTIAKLDKSGQMHPAYSRRNPLDLVGDALPKRYEVAINTLLSEPYISGIIVIQTLQTMTDPEEDAKIIINAHKKHPNKPIICVFMGGYFSRKGVLLLEENGIPNYNDVSKAAKAMWALIQRGEQK